MADVDDELLALVGGDESSDDEGSEQEMNISQSGSEHESESRKESTSKNKKSAPTSKPKKRRQDDSDEEEGEASSAASPASQASAPMDESDSEAGSPAANNANGASFDDDDKYPYEGMFANAREKAEIMSMREVERESILAERAQEIERQRQNRLLRQLVSQGEHDKKAIKKRKAEDADIEDTQRKTSRQRTKLGGSKVGETSAGIESLRRARAEKSDRQRRQAEDRERNKDKSTAVTHSSPDRDAGGDSDVEWGRDSRKRASKSRTPEIKEIPLAELRDIERIRLGRSRFAQICFFPGLEEAITGCFARINIGPNARLADGVNEYRMALIKRFTTGKPYAMEKANGQNFVTDQYVVAAHGKAERDWPFVACSDGAFTEAEFNRYKSTLQFEGLIFPKRPALAAKIDAINNLRNRSWTDGELDEKLQRERTLRNKYAPTERDRLTKAIDEAKQYGDSAKVAELQDQLDSVETPRLAYKTSLTPTKKNPAAGLSQQDRLAQLNIENRRRNAEAVRKAQLKEKAKSREMEARIARGEEVTEDTSRRLRTQPKFMQDVNGPERKSTPGNGSGASTPANGTPKLGASKASALPAHIARLQAQTHATNSEKKGIPQIHRPLVDDDIIGALDLDIDIEID